MLRRRWPHPRARPGSRQHPVSGQTATGHAGTEILKRANAADHDLIVLGSRGRGAIRSAVRGSVSHLVLNHGTVPMLIVHDNGEESSVPAG